MAELLGEETVLVDVNHGPAAIASGLAGASATLGCDVVVFVDVGGDVLAHGDEPGLASPLLVHDARDLDAANDILHGLGVRTELDYERDASTSV